MYQNSHRGFLDGDNDFLRREILQGSRVIFPLKPGFVQRTIHQLGSIFQITLRSRSKTVPEKSVIVFHFKFDQQFSNRNRDHDPDQKTFRENR